MLWRLKMTKQATIYHNPKCSKSRASLKILQDHNVEIKEIRYLEHPPSKETLKQLCALMSVSPLKIIRTGESLFKEIGLNSDDNKTDDEWLDILVQHPKLIERPIIQIDNQVVIGRPPENVRSLFA